MGSVVEKELSAQLVDACYAAHRGLGTGLLESVYESALVVELNARGLEVQRQVPYKVYYRTQVVCYYYADLVVEKRLVVELKAAKVLTETMVAQLLNYLRISRIPLGYLVNFGMQSLEYRRYVV